MIVRTFQSRMGHFQDKIRRKLVDNNISLTGQAADCIRIRLKKTRNGDIETRVVEDVNVISVIFPILKDVPFRRLTRSPGGIRIDTIPTAIELFPLQITVSHSNNIYIGDLIFRIFKDQETPTYLNDYVMDENTEDMLDGVHNPNLAGPIVLVLEVKESLGTFGVESMIWTKYNCTYNDESLPDELLETVVELSNRRLALGW